MCPQSVALGVSPVKWLFGCQVADAGSIPQFVGRPVQSLEELRWLHVQGLDDFQDVDQRKVVLSPLNASHVTAVYAASISKRLLRVPTSLAPRPYSFAKPHQLINLDPSGLLRFDHVWMVES